MISSVKSYMPSLDSITVASFQSHIRTGEPFTQVKLYSPEFDLIERACFSFLFFFNRGIVLVLQTIDVQKYNAKASISLILS